MRFAQVPFLAVQVVVVAALLLVVDAGDGAAQQPAPPTAATADPPGGWPKNWAELDRLLGEKRYAELVAALNASNRFEDVVSNMNWQRNKLTRGATSLIGFSYARDLWRIGSAVPVDRPEADPKNTAGLILLYT
jgi:hypothetical protein